MKVYIFADQEGVAGVFSRREKYLYATEYATMELAAICEALLANGVDEILLNSVHVVEYHKLPKQVTVLRGSTRSRRKVMSTVGTATTTMPASDTTSMTPTVRTTRGTTPSSWVKSSLARPSAE